MKSSRELPPISATFGYLDRKEESTRLKQASDKRQWKREFNTFLKTEVLEMVGEIVDKDNLHLLKLGKYYYTKINNRLAIGEVVRRNNDTVIKVNKVCLPIIGKKILELY